jgi:predicted kinase
MITVVTGAPCSGKSTHVAQHATTGDIVIDMDRIALALTVDGATHHDYDEKLRSVARAARNAAVKQALSVAQGERYLNVWIIHTDPSANDRQMYRAMNARIMEIDPGKQICLERLGSRPERNKMVARKVIEDYYAKR